MNDVFRNLAISCTEGINEYENRYVRNVKDVFSVTTDPNVLKVQIQTKRLEYAESFLRFSLVFNELSLFICPGSSRLSLIELSPKWFEDNFGVKGAEVVVSNKKMVELELDPASPSILPAFIFPRGNEFDELAMKLMPFIERGKLLIQPHRSLFILKTAEEGRRRWESIKVDPFAPLESWQVIDEELSRPIPLRGGVEENENQQMMFEVTIPYLEGVRFIDLAKILDDEGDLVSALRVSIKNAINECDRTSDPRIIARDIIDPKVDALNRKFRSLVNSHFFRIAGAALGTVALAYTAVTTSGLASAVATISGSGGVGLLGREYSSYREKLNEIKDDPHYFLWRCKKLT